MRRVAAVGLAVLLIGTALSLGPLGDVSDGDPAAPGTPTVDSPATATASPVDDGSARRTRLQFEEVALERGFGYTYDQTFEGQMETLSNAGIYASDYDNDGWTDLLAIGGERPALFRNERGSFRRVDALPRLDRTVRGALFLDYDRDGWDDILLLASNRTPVLLENEGGQFTVADAGFDRPLGLPVGATVGDYDRDGCPDLFVIQYGDWFQDQPVGMLDLTVAPGADNGDPNVLYDGDCSSFDRARDAGVAGSRWSLATSFVDLTGDGRLDIHVANDFNNDVVYVNRGDGTFDERILENTTNRNAMSSEVADVDGDGRPDLFVTNVWFPTWFSEKLSTTMGRRDEGNNLLLNRGNGTFADRAGRYGLERGGWGWAATMADFDNDMDRDLFHTTSWIRFTAGNTELSPMEVIRFQMRHPYYHYPVLAERNATGFTRPVAPSDLGLRASGGRGVARLDVDRDGDQDLAVANSSRNGTYLLYENTLDRGSAVELRVVTNGTRALGARVTVTAGDRVQRRWVTAQSDYLSQESRVLHVGTGDWARVDITVVWPDGRHRTFEGVPTDQRLLLAPGGIRRSTPLNGSAA